MPSIRQIPEVAALRSSRGVVRIPPEMDVPLTPRVRRLLDSAPMRRLANISQLGLVKLVYPGATHSRLEHSLGVYRNALLYLDRLAEDPRFTDLASPEHAERFLIAALLHDVGHWPFCHPLEDVQLKAAPAHELLAERYLTEGEIADLLQDDWKVEPLEIARLLAGAGSSPVETVLQSMLSGPIDVDKMDYLMRDSLHAGVPYGRHFDRPRLIQCLCLNEAGDGLALTDKGKTAAEMMVFSRYVMFSEVYWHHAVRSATAMLQRAFAMVLQRLDVTKAIMADESKFVSQLRTAAQKSAAAKLIDGLFGEHRRLYKRCAQYSLFQHPELFRKLARRPYESLLQCTERLADALGEKLGARAAAHELLLDAPPVKLEVQFRVDVFFSKEGIYRPLGEISPVVRTLAERQFDDYVKRVRLFASPRIARSLQDSGRVDELLLQAVSN